MSGSEPVPLEAEPVIPFKSEQPSLDPLGVLTPVYSGDPGQAAKSAPLHSLKSTQRSSKGCLGAEEYKQIPTALTNLGG